ncbi:DUF192 domain-containing protein [Sphingomonas edaphi]|uniref:DUF192 domain-containing protein n=1 Tax=Sphingomonas edaphi TaxID=2315689 RepID=A0A418Q471_9SPHN|nr:DUF192 domain-containing protein [Sphingomonas edaphi]
MIFALAALGAGASLPACQPSTFSAAEVGRSAAGLEQLPLTISAGGATHQFTVEVARTEEEQAYGLMNRNELAPNRGMIFPFAQVRQASFWMKDTLIPLDIIFIRADGIIANIENAVPLSLEPVTSMGPVAAVLEIPGGRSAELGIKPGHKVTW